LPFPTGLKRTKVGLKYSQAQEPHCHEEGLKRTKVGLK